MRGDVPATALRMRPTLCAGLALSVLLALTVLPVSGQTPVPLDPTTLPKYVTPLVIPPP